MGLLGDAVGLAKDPFNKNRIKQQQAGLKSGVYTDQKWWSPNAPASSTNASDTYAGITRDQWADYKANYAPYEEQMIAMAKGEQDNQLSEARAVNAVNTGFNSSLATLGRDRQRLGLSIGTDQAADETRLAAGAKTGSLVSAANKARLHAQDRDMAMLTGGLSDLRPTKNGVQQ